MFEKVLQEKHTSDIIQYMKTYIMFGILITLLREKQSTYKKLAEKYEVSPKTIQRYLNQMETAGVPTITKQGKNGGISLYNNFSLESTFLSREELAKVISLVSSFAPTLCLQLESIIDKFKVAGKETTLAELEKRSEMLMIDNSIWCTNQQHLQSTILQAIESSTKLEIDYHCTDGKSTRTIHPHVLIQKCSEWYIYSFCEQKQDFRLFKCCRITAVKVLSEHFQRQPIESGEWNKRMATNFQTIELKMELSAEIEPDIQTWAKTQHENGIITATTTATLNNGLIHKLMTYGHKLKVVAPKDLQMKLAQECQEITSLYQT